MDKVLPTDAGDAITTVDGYFAAQPQPQQSTLRAMRAAVLDLIPDAHERYSYRIAVYRYRGKDTVALSGYASHCSLHAMSAAVARQVVEADETGTLKLSGSTVQFPIDEPMDPALLQLAIAGRMSEIDALLDR